MTREDCFLSVALAFCGACAAGGLFYLGLWLIMTSTTYYEGFTATIVDVRPKGYQLQIAPYYPVRCTEAACAVIQFTNAANFTGQCYVFGIDTRRYQAGSNFTIYREGWFIENEQPMCAVDSSQERTGRNGGGLILCIFMGIFILGGFCGMFVVCDTYNRENNTPHDKLEGNTQEGHKVSVVINPQETLNTTDEGS